MDCKYAPTPHCSPLSADPNGFENYYEEEPESPAYSPTVLGHLGPASADTSDLSVNAVIDLVFPPLSSKEKEENAAKDLRRMLEQFEGTVLLRTDPQDFTEIKPCSFTSKNLQDTKDHFALITDDQRTAAKKQFKALIEGHVGQTDTIKEFVFPACTAEDGDVFLPEKRALSPQPTVRRSNRIANRQ